MLLFKRIEKRKGDDQRTKANIGLFMKIFSKLLFLRVLLFALDVASDTALLLDYHVSDKNITVFNSSQNSMNCSEDSIELECFSNAITQNERFWATITVMLIPNLFYFFELLRFRTFSAWLESKWDPETINSFIFYTVYKPMKLICNTILVFLWPFVAFFRQAWACFNYESSEDVDKTGQLQISAKAARTVSSRAQIIEVCLESSLQPLLQLYLVLINLIIVNNSDIDGVSSRIIDPTDWIKGVGNAIGHLADKEGRRIAASVISILAIAASFTSQYRQNKDYTVNFMASVIYFLYICLGVITRILCFEMFALYLGPGRLFKEGLVIVLLHVILMALLHFIFSDSVKQCYRRKDQFCSAWLRQLMLVMHNCLINGLANLYIHNNLEIFVQYDENSQSRSRKKSIGYEEATYAPPDSRQPTFLRQFLVDSIFFMENVTMIVLAKDTKTFPRIDKSYNIILYVIIACYLSSLLLKFLYYWYFHPWSAIIKPLKTQDEAGRNHRIFQLSTMICSKKVERTFKIPA